MKDKRKEFIDFLNEKKVEVDNMKDWEKKYFNKGENEVVLDVDPKKLYTIKCSDGAIYKNVIGSVITYYNKTKLKSSPDIIETKEVK